MFAVSSFETARNETEKIPSGRNEGYDEQPMVGCIAHFCQPDSRGKRLLSLAKEEILIHEYML